jgi:hypothetical protein
MKIDTVMESTESKQCFDRTADVLMAPDDARARNQELFCLS